MITLKTDHATATVSPYGAQVMSFIPHGQPDVLWRTTPDFLQAALVKGKALRGGIPVCWPWFLGHPTVEGAPSHGVGRIMEWDLVTHEERADEARAVLAVELDGTDAAWPYKTRGELEVVLTDALVVRLVTENLSGEPFTLTQALHTYVRVGDIANVRVEGLEGAVRRHVSSGTPYGPHEGPFVFMEETEQLVRPVSELVLRDVSLERVVTVTNKGSREFVVWNPWIEKAKGLDMPPEDYKQMVCLEAANIDGAVVVEAGGRHVLETRIAVGRG